MNIKLQIEESYSSLLLSCLSDFRLYECMNPIANEYQATIEESYSSLLLLEVTLDCMNASKSHC